MKKAVPCILLCVYFCALFYIAYVTSYSFEINVESVKLVPGDSTDLSVTSSKELEISWSSSDESIATVDENGTVTAVASGDAVITATESHGNQSKIPVLVDAYNWSLIQYADESGSQGMFYTLKNVDTGTLIVIDGGNEGNTEQVRRAILNLGGGWWIAGFLRIFIRTIVRHLMQYMRIHKESPLIRFMRHRWIGIILSRWPSGGILRKPMRLF